MHRVPVNFAVIALCMGASICGLAQDNDRITGKEVVLKSIDYHDPDGQWGHAEMSFRLLESRPGTPLEEGGNYRITDLVIAPGQGLFSLTQQRGADLIVRRVSADSCSLTLNGRSAMADSLKEQFRLTCVYSRRMRDYYTYLWGLPMKLTDEGTIIHDDVRRSDFFGEQLLEVKVTYDENVGSDTWYFYFDPETYALSGYRFYHNESANDGEYILLDGQAKVGAFLLPRQRKWYTHSDNEFLGEDRIIFNTE